MMIDLQRMAEDSFLINKTEEEFLNDTDFTLNELKKCASHVITATESYKEFVSITAQKLLNDINTMKVYQKRKQEISESLAELLLDTLAVFKAIKEPRIECTVNGILEERKSAVKQYDECVVEIPLEEKKQGE